MRRIFLSLSLFLSFSLYAWDSFRDFPPLDHYYHPITTNSKEAQEAFSRGLLAIYAFNYDEALRSFDRVTELDPECAMGYWGMAMALDQNLDPTVSANHAKLTWHLYEKAVQFSDKVSENEKAYIQALRERFSEDPNTDKNKLRARYKEAMAKVFAKYPDDLDAAVLYAESYMDLLSWKFWRHDKKPYKGTEQIVQILEAVLKRNPWHPGANHYFIHAMEDSKNPEIALMSAYRLDEMNLLEWGHLLHTTTHIYLKVGFYERAVIANKKAIHADREYIKKHGYEGKYPLKYLSHNLFYLTLSYMWQERMEKATETAKELQDLILPYIAEAPMLEFNLIMPMQVAVYFRKWDEIFAIPEPEKKYEIVNLFWLFARTVAYAATNQLAEMDTAKDLFFKQKEKLYGKDSSSDKSMNDTFNIAEKVLLGFVAKAKGKKEEASSFFKQAALLQDNAGDLAWFHPLRQSYGASLMEARHFREAEQVFREGLNKCPRNGRLLFGLGKAINAQGKFDYWIEREKREALRFSTYNLKLGDL